MITCKRHNRHSGGISLRRVVQTWLVAFVVLFAGVTQSGLVPALQQHPQRKLRRVVITFLFAPRRASSLYLLRRLTGSWHQLRPIRLTKCRSMRFARFVQTITGRWRRLICPMSRRCRSFMMSAMPRQLPLSRSMTSRAVAIPGHPRFPSDFKY